MWATCGYVGEGEQTSYLWLNWTGDGEYRLGLVDEDPLNINNIKLVPRGIPVYDAEGNKVMEWNYCSNEPFLYYERQNWITGCMASTLKHIRVESDLE